MDAFYELFTYQNVGRDIKTIAVITAAITFICTLIMAIGLYVVMIINLGLLGFILGLFVFFIIVGIGFLTARLSSIVLYAFGELVELTAENNDYLRRISDSTNKVAENEAPTPKKAPKASNGKTVNHADGSWTCSCGRKNAPYVTSCACGKSRGGKNSLIKRAEDKKNEAAPASPMSPVTVHEDGSWTCSCGKNNPSFVVSCSCGNSKKNTAPAKEDAEV